MSASDLDRLGALPAPVQMLDPIANTRARSPGWPRSLVGRRHELSRQRTTTPRPHSPCKTATENPVRVRSDGSINIYGNHILKLVRARGGSRRCTRRPSRPPCLFPHDIRARWQHLCTSSLRRRHRLEQAPKHRRRGPGQPVVAASHGHTGLPGTQARSHLYSALTAGRRPWDRSLLRRQSPRNKGR